MAEKGSKQISEIKPARGLGLASGASGGSASVPMRSDGYDGAHSGRDPLFGKIDELKAFARQNGKQV